MANTIANKPVITVKAEQAKLNLSEGTRADLEMYGYATSPFTGELLVGTGADDVRVATPEEHKAAAKAYQNRMKNANEKESTLL